MKSVSTKTYDIVRDIMAETVGFLKGAQSYGEKVEGGSLVPGSVCIQNGALPVAKGESKEVVIVGIGVRPDGDLTVWHCHLQDSDGNPPAVVGARCCIATKGAKLDDYFKVVGHIDNWDCDPRINDLKAKHAELMDALSKVKSTADEMGVTLG